MRILVFLCTLVVGVALAALYATTTPVAAMFEPTATLVKGAASPTDNCTSAWYISYGGSESYTQTFTDTEGIPIENIYTERGFHGPLDVSEGFLDFDGDRKSDLFSAVPSTEKQGYWQFRYASAGAGPWINLGTGPVGPDQVRFGDFNGDRITDVFWVILLPDGFWHWQYSAGGLTRPLNLAYDTVPVEALRFGDFNADGITDVFNARPLSATNYAWLVSYGAIEAWVQVNEADHDPAKFRFGDIDSDGKTDVISEIPLANGRFEWVYSSGATQPFGTLGASVDRSIGTTRVGDFNADDRTDIFLNAGGQWKYFSFYPETQLINLAFGEADDAVLRFGDFNFDSRTDVFTAVRTCVSGDSMTYLPMTRK